MKAALLDYHQKLMARSQSEQIWAIAAYAGLNAFVITNAESFAQNIDRCPLLWTIGLLGGLTWLFVVQRIEAYYIYRNEVARLLADVDEAHEKTKEAKSALNPYSGIWLLVFTFWIVIPFLAMASLTAGAGKKQESNQPPQPTQVSSADLSG